MSVDHLIAGIKSKMNILLKCSLFSCHLDGPLWSCHPCIIWLVGLFVSLEAFVASSLTFCSTASFCTWQEKSCGGNIAVMCFFSSLSHLSSNDIMLNHCTESVSMSLRTCCHIITFVHEGLSFHRLLHTYCIVETRCPSLCIQIWNLF